MTYQLGVDLGTTYTAAAVARGDEVTIVHLGTRSASVPSVVFLKEDETILVGEAAVRRGTTEGHRVAREFKRRIGDTTPIILGSTPYSAEALMARLLGWVVEEVTRREGGPPESVTVTHPANWGNYKKDLLQQAIRLADISAATLITEPEAAVLHYASQARIDTGRVIAVYDLGGGTFDAAILRKTADGFEPLGTPEGIERLGGIDFDEAVFSHVQRALAAANIAVDATDPQTVSALWRLRDECAEAKEALSADSDVAIPVLLPNVSTEVRLTRGEFESMIRPSLADSLGAMQRAVRGAGLEMNQIDAVLLVGGSSRIPLIGELVAGELGRPIVVDAHPKHAIALGAALYGAHHAGSSGGGASGPGATAAAGGAAAAAAGLAAAAAATPPAEPPTPPAPEPAPSPAAADVPTEATPAVPTAPPAARVTAASAPPPVTPTSLQPPQSAEGGGPNKALIIGAVAAVLAVIVGVGVFALGGGDGDDTTDVDATADGEAATDADDGSADATDADDAADTAGQAMARSPPPTPRRLPPRHPSPRSQPHRFPPRNPLRCRRRRRCRSRPTPVASSSPRSNRTARPSRSSTTRSTTNRASPGVSSTSTSSGTSTHPRAWARHHRAQNPWTVWAFDDNGDKRFDDPDLAFASPPADASGICAIVANARTTRSTPPRLVDATVSCIDLP